MKTYRNAERTRRTIQQTFAALLQEKGSLERITVQELTARADIAKSTFYNHYADVYAVAGEFENELLEHLFSAIAEAEHASAPQYEEHMRTLLAFLSAHESIYRSAVTSPDTRYFVEKLKFLLARKLFAASGFPFSDDPTRRQIEISFFTNACVDTLCDYYRGAIDASLEMVGETIIELLHRATGS